VQADLAAGKLSAGHARALLALDGDAAQKSLAREVIQRRLSVRETEVEVGRAKSAAVPTTREDPDLRALASI
jgi:ParB family chromosome partitioning protein